MKKQLDEGYHMFRHLEIENVKIKERILIDDGERERENLCNLNPIAFNISFVCVQFPVKPFSLSLSSPSNTSNIPSRQHSDMTVCIATRREKEKK